MDASSTCEPGPYRETPCVKGDFDRLVDQATCGQGIENHADQFGPFNKSMLARSQSEIRAKTIRR